MTCAFLGDVMTYIFWTVYVAFYINYAVCVVMAFSAGSRCNKRKTTQLSHTWHTFTASNPFYFWSRSYKKYNLPSACKEGSAWTDSCVFLLFLTMCVSSTNGILARGLTPYHVEQEWSGRPIYTYTQYCHHILNRAPPSFTVRLDIPTM